MAAPREEILSTPSVSLLMLYFTFFIVPKLESPNNFFLPNTHIFPYMRFWKWAKVIHVGPIREVPMCKLVRCVLRKTQIWCLLFVRVSRPLVSTIFSFHLHLRWDPTSMIPWSRCDLMPFSIRAMFSAVHRELPIVALWKKDKVLLRLFRVGIDWCALLMFWKKKKKKKNYIK